VEVQSMGLTMALSCKLCDDGFAPAWMALKVRVVGEESKAGVAKALVGRVHTPRPCVAARSVVKPESLKS
jgi:hypothetical protein